ncbi:hypothetical protein F4778DRAFT_794136 [Xylariomycetidae sp. FL2044]|nr:hypothetical protein F4778DRAFT_794136 [Xylariomycetidae sp. FL2044]
MAHSSTPIDSLPNEIISHSLSFLPTRSLLPLAIVCRRWRQLVGRLHYVRLVAATRLQGGDHKVLLECCHPIERMTTPWLVCKYLGTEGLLEAGARPNMAELNRLYTRFQPSPRKQCSGPAAEVPFHDIYLESGELFSQLHIAVKLVQNGPRRGLFVNSVPVCDNVIRIWRDYLRRESGISNSRGHQKETSCSLESSVLWTDSSRNIGLKFRVTGNGDASVPVLTDINEDESVHYRLEYQELFIRTKALNFSLEVSASQRERHSGDIIFLRPLTANYNTMAPYKHSAGSPTSLPSMVL